MGLNGIKKRVDTIERSTRAARPTMTTYHCIIEGEAQVMTLLDFTFATVVEGKKGTMGRIAGEVPIDPPDPGELERAFQEMVDEYNSPEAEAKRKAEREELDRIAELRRMDFYAGRDMDECHPLPWQKRS